MIKPINLTEQGVQFSLPSNYRRWDVIKYFINVFKYNKGVELGVNKGENFFNLLENNNDLILYGIDIFEVQKDNTLENYGGNDFLNSYKNEVIQKLKKFKTRAQILIERTDIAHKHFDDESLDFVFIDADHSYESVKKDIFIWKRKIKENGLLMGHDMNWGDVSRAVGESFSEIWLCPDNVWIAPKHWLRN